jgi:tryptophan-rich sensory protein
VSEPTHRSSTGGSWVALLGFIALCLGVAAIGGWATSISVGGWYQALDKPEWTPPDRIFAPVWTILYLMMAVAGYRVWRGGPSKGRQDALALFAIQLALNMLWSILFFGSQRIGLALLDILLLWAAIAATGFAFWRVDRLAGLLLLPYLAWVTYAVSLNAAIWRLN